MRTAPFFATVSRRLSLLPLLLLAALESQALTLGRVQGAAIIGRTLDVSVQVQLDPGQAITSACFDADVFHADTKQSPAGVSVRLEPAASGQSGNLRITSDSRIDEPVVTIYVRAGCAQMTTRRYVLLADIVSEQAIPAPRVAAVPLVDPSRSPAEPLGGAVAASGDRSSRGAASTPGGTAASGTPRAAPAARRPRAAGAAATARSRNPDPAVPAARAAPARSRGAAAPETPARVTGQSRLKLDPLETLSERVATLESSKPPVPSDIAEREALEQQRLQRLEASVMSLLALAQKNEAGLRDVRAQLARAQSDRFSNPVIYTLLGLALLALLAIAYLLTRANRRVEEDDSMWLASAQQPDPDPYASPGGGKSSGSGVAPVSDSRLGALSAPGPLSRPPPLQQTDRLPIEATRPMVQAPGAPQPSAAATPVDVSLVDMSESTFHRLMQPGATGNASRQALDTVPLSATLQGDGAATVPVSPAPRINADELIDVRQRAEFFVSLGQTDQAVQVLESRIAQDASSCPQAYLDLLKLFHSLGLKADFNQLRDDFVRRFNARLPEFARFADEGRTLEDYPGAVDRLIAAWSKPSAVHAIEQMLYRHPSDAGRDANFDLAAFRELLLVHAVAHSVRGLAAGRTGAHRTQAPMPDGGASPQVDIDLSELFSSDSAPTVVMPERADRTAPSRRAAPGTVPGGNAIDFDLGDAHSVRGPAGKS